LFQGWGLFPTKGSNDETDENERQTASLSGCSFAQFARQVERIVRFFFNGLNMSDRMLLDIFDNLSGVAF
jgi:hypothetical protein